MSDISRPVHLYVVLLTPAVVHGVCLSVCLSVCPRTVKRNGLSYQHQTRDRDTCVQFVAGPWHARR